jgi:hypothetical protein
MPAMISIKPNFYSNFFPQVYENKEKQFITSPEDYSLTKIRKFCDGELVLRYIGGDRWGNCSATEQVRLVRVPGEPR